jgi:menaquinone-dependent protoporphyrinogen oxidase
MTARVLVTAASRHGATHEIGAAIADGLRSRSVDAHFRPAEELGSLDGYDAFVIGSAVYVGHWLDPAKDLVAEHAAALAGAPLWLFSSGPLGPPEALKPEGDPVEVDALTATVEAVEHRVFAGRLEKKLLGFGEKALVVAVRAPEGDFRDWNAIDAFAGEIAAHLTGD